MTGKKKSAQVAGTVDSPGGEKKKTAEGRKSGQPGNRREVRKTAKEEDEVKGELVPNSSVGRGEMTPVAAPGKQTFDRGK